MPGPLFDLRCARCDAPYPAAGLPATCPACGGFWAPPALVWREPLPLPGLRRWAHVLGLDPAELPERELGRPPELLFGAWVLQQGSAPSGSYKERGAEVMLAAALRRGLPEIFLDSSGNAGIAVARAAAERGVRCSVLVPASTPGTKRRSIERWGGTVVVVRGDREATAASAASWRSRLPYASHVYQPAFHAGVATLVWDLYEQLEGKLPGRWLLPAGNGALLLGIGIGLEALRRAGRIEELPALSAVQLEGYAALHPEGPGERAPGPPVAAGIASVDPPRRAEMLEWIARTGGDVTRVSEEDIAAARTELTGRGFPADPTGAAAWAGLGRRLDLHGSEKPLVIVSSRDEGQPPNPSPSLRFE